MPCKNNVLPLCKETRVGMERSLEGFHRNILQHRLREATSPERVLKSVRGSSSTCSSIRIVLHGGLQMCRLDIRRPEPSSDEHSKAYLRVSCDMRLSQ